MDVRCGRCGTEYEFDDALISERGTTVKCTNCGHQFRIFPPSSGAPVPERWVVRTGSGRELVFTSLRDLQRGIAQRQVSPGDLLSRGSQPVRPLGSIAELEPFFRTGDQPEGGERQPDRQPQTLHGVAPPPDPDASGAVVRPTGPPPAPVYTQRVTEPIREPVESRDSVTPLRYGEVAQAIQRAASSRPPVSPSAVTQPVPQIWAAPPARLQHELEPPPDASQVKPVFPARAQLEPSVSAPPPKLEPGLASAELPPFTGYDELAAAQLDDGMYARRSSHWRWIAGVVVVLAFALFTVTLGRTFLQRLANPEQREAAAADERVQGMLERAQRALDQGDLEAAKEELDKASVLADAHPAVLLALANLEIVRADLLWLKRALLDPDDSAGAANLERELGRRVTRAREALERAAAVAPKNAEIALLRGEILRLEGKQQEARAELTSLGESASRPQSRLALALLDASGENPSWPSIVDRLRSVSAQEAGLGRARAALVYALMRAGAIDEARTELDKLTRESKHPLTMDLSVFVRRHTLISDAGAEQEAPLPAVDVSKLPKLATPAPARDGRQIPGDFRSQLEQAGKALAAGDLDRAERLYNAVLLKHPGNTEAVAGLGDVARKRKDPATAEEMYERALRDNPSYLPALMASADQKWDQGDRKGALGLYRRVLEQAGQSSAYGQRARARIALGEQTPESGESPAPSASVPTPEASRTPPAEAEPPAPEAPHIDTTDLPENGQ
jgi:predicted Zn finger-like uncharacterized protein